MFQKDETSPQKRGEMYEARVSWFPNHCPKGFKFNNNGDIRKLVSLSQWVEPFAKEQEQIRKSLGIQSRSNRYFWCTVGCSQIVWYAQEGIPSGLFHFVMATGLILMLIGADHCHAEHQRRKILMRELMENAGEAVGHLFHIDQNLLEKSKPSHWTKITSKELLLFCVLERQRQANPQPGWWEKRYQKIARLWRQTS